MYKFCLVFTILFFIQNTDCFAQKNFRTGYVITHQNDTLTGLIHSYSNEKNYKNFRFKKDDQITVYAPNQIKGYGISGEAFFSSVILDTAFVEILVKGALNLYKFGNIYFAQKPDGKLYKLESTRKKVSTNGKIVIQEQGKWKGLLTYLTFDCLKGKSAVQDLIFNERNLTKLVIQYNQCKNANYRVFNDAKPWFKLDAGAAIGLTPSFLKANVRNFLRSEFGLNKRYVSYDPSFGILLGFSSPNVSERISFQTGFHYFNAGYSASLKENLTSYTVYFESFIDLASLSIPLSLKYKIPLRKTSFLIQGGYNFEILLNGTNKLVTETVIKNSGNIQTSEEQVFPFNNTQSGFMAGLGLLHSFKFFRGGITLKYFFANEFTREAGLDVNNHRLLFSINIFK